MPSATVTLKPDSSLKWMLVKPTEVLVEKGFLIPEISHTKAPEDWLKSLKVTTMSWPLTEQSRDLRLARPVQFIASTESGAPRS